jgi:hypothetical protein
MCADRCLSKKESIRAVRRGRLSAAEDFSPFAQSVVVVHDMAINKILLKKSRFVMPARFFNDAFVL